MAGIVERSSGEKAPAEATVVGHTTGAVAEARRAVDLARLRWGLRAGGGILAFIGAAVLSLAHAAGLGWEFHLLNGVVFLGIILMAYAFAAISRGTHVEREQRHEAQLFSRTIQLQDMAMRDELTRLFNRRYFFHRLEQELDVARASQGQLAVVLLDVDKLKDINDTFGHQVGDAALSNLAQVLVKCSRTGDVSARLAGDEFGVIMPQTGKQGALAFGERIKQALDASPACQQGRQSIKLSVSIGMSFFPGGGETADELVGRADTGMYAAKAAGHRGTDIERPMSFRSGPSV